MADKIVERINELYKKSKTEGLSEEEKREQKELRAKYLEGFRKNLQATLNNTYIVDENGEKTKLTSRGNGKKNGSVS